MFSRIFNPNNDFFTYISKLFDAILLSVLWVALCLPVVTAAPATAALYYTVVKCLRGGDLGTFGHFFRSFRENFKVGALTGLLLMVLWAALLWGCVLLFVVAEQELGSLLLATYCCLLVIPLAVSCFALATLGRFTFGVKALLSTALRLVFAHLPSALLVALSTAAITAFTLRWAWPIFFAPALLLWFWSVLLERIYAPFLPVEPNIEEAEIST